MLGSRRPKRYRMYDETDCSVPARTQRYWRQRERERIAAEAALNNAEEALRIPTPTTPPAGLESTEDLSMDDTLPVENVDQDVDDTSGLADNGLGSESDDVAAAHSETLENASWDPTFDVVEHLAQINVAQQDEGIGSFEGEEDDIGNTVGFSGALSASALDAPLYPNAGVTKFETILMIFNLVLRHGMTGVFLEDMMKFVSTIVGDDNAIPASKYYFHKLFSVDKELDVHFYCPVCEIYLGPKINYSSEVVCRRCKSVSTSSSFNDGSFFVTLSIKDQLESLLKRPGTELNYPVRDRPAGIISDIYDGKIYKSLLRHCQNLGKKDPLTVTINTDGSPVFKCTSKSSLWPVQYILNELPPKARFAPENVLLAGLWFGRQPIVDAYLKPIVDELNALSIDGVRLRHSTGDIVQVPVFAICCVTDSAARPKVQKHHLHNGAFGCGYCLHPGVSTIVNENTGTSQLRYIADVMYPLRTDDGLRLDMEAATKIPSGEKVKHVHGSLGVSPLCNLNMFDVVFGFGIDYMHAVLEGTISKLCHLWFDSTSRKLGHNKYYIGLKVDRVNKRMKTISPPSWFRVTRPVTERGKYKSRDWLAFLLFYALPCLDGILPDAYHRHVKKLVTATYYLLQESMTYADVERSNELLHDFVVRYADLYNDKDMVYNVHLMLHLGKCVAMLGPLWAYSAFCFESGNGRLVKLVNGTTGVATQIARKYQMVNNAEEIVNSGYYNVSPNALNFCDSVVCYKRAQNSVKIGDVTCLGVSGMINLSNRNILLESGRKVFDCYARVVKDGIMYHARRHSRQTRNNDSCVKLDTGQYAILESVFVDTEEVWCLVRVIRFPRQNDPKMPHHILRTSIDPFEDESAIPFSNVKKKCVLINCDNLYYVSECPNNFDAE